MNPIANINAIVCLSVICNAVKALFIIALFCIKVLPAGDTESIAALENVEVTSSVTKSIPVAELIVAAMLAAAGTAKMFERSS